MSWQKNIQQKMESRKKAELYISNSAVIALLWVTGYFQPTLPSNLQKQTPAARSQKSMRKGFGLYLLINLHETS